MEAKPSLMSLMNEFFSVWPNLKITDLEKVVAEDCVTYEAACLPYGGSWVGPEGFLALVTKVMSTWENMAVKIESVFSNEVDLVAVRVRITGDAPYGHFDMPVLELWTFRNGKAVEIIPAYFDTHALVELANGARGDYRAVYTR